MNNEEKKKTISEVSIFLLAAAPTQGHFPIYTYYIYIYAMGFLLATNSAEAQGGSQGGPGN